MAEVRRLRESDLEQAYELSTAAGWNQTRTDWKRLLTLDGDGCFCVEEDGRVVTTTTAVRYGQDLAWIGMVLTRPEYRGRGHARRLMEQALAWLDAEGVGRTMLDATEMGLPLYRKLGFIEDYPVERWFRRDSPQEAPHMTMQPFSVRDWMDKDREAFGADRSRLIELLARRYGVSVAGEGYALGRPGRIAAYFGPCLAMDSDVARTLLTSYLARSHGEAVMWDLIPVDPATLRLARAFGFEPMRYLTRMRRGGEYRAPSRLAVAIAGLEYG